MNGTHLKVMLEIIDAGAERGSFKGDELLYVGSLRSVIEAELTKIPSDIQLKDAEWTFGYKADSEKQS